jgi:hypothetical protein
MLRSNERMDGPIEKLVERTGVVIPLAARLLEVIADSGASQLEITIALSVVGQLRNALPGRQLPEYLESRSE